MEIRYYQKMEEVSESGSLMKAESSNGKYKVYKQRWLVLFSYCIISVAATPNPTAFTGISNILQKYYRVHATAIHMLFIMYGGMVLMTTLPWSYLLHKFELGFVLKTSAIIHLAGTTIRYFGEHQPTGYYFLMSGNLLSAIAFAGYIYVGPKLAQNWFAENEKGRVTGACVGFDMVATALGYIHSTNAIRNSDDFLEIKEDIKSFLLQQLVVAGAATAMVFLFSQSRPKTPPSKVESIRLANEKKSKKRVELNLIDHKERNEHGKERINSYGCHRNFWKSIKTLLKNRNYLLLIHLLAIVVALELTVETLLNDSLIPMFPGKEREIGIVGFTSITIGFISNVLVGLIIDKTKAYKYTSVTIYGLMFLCSVIWTLLLEFYPSFPLVALTGALYIVTGLSYYAVSLTYLVITTQTVSPGISTMIMSITCSFYGNSTALLGSIILENMSLLHVNVMLSLAVLIGWLLSFLSK